MPLREVTVQDHMRGSGEQITIRFDQKDVVELPCHCEYDPALCSKEGNRVKLMRNIEVRKPDGSWGPYPSYTWLDGVQGEEQLVTRAIVMLTGDDSPSIMVSTQGVPDGKLGIAAGEVGIYTETIDG